MISCQPGIGACRAVWVPRQDLATLHLMCNCRKRILSLHCTLYIRLCTHILYAGDHMSSRPVLMIRVHMIQNNSGNARVCPGLQASTIVAEAVSKIFALVFNIDLRVYFYFPDDEFLTAPHNVTLMEGEMLTQDCLHQFGQAYTWRVNGIHVNSRSNKVCLLITMVARERSSRKKKSLFQCHKWEGFEACLFLCLLLDCFVTL